MLGQNTAQFTVTTAARARDGLEGLYNTFKRFQESVSQTVVSSLEHFVRETEFTNIKVDRLSQFDNLVLVRILCFCDVHTACAWSRTNRRFFRFVYASPEADQLFWKREYIRKFPNRGLDSKVALDEVNSKLLRANLHYFHMLRTIRLPFASQSVLAGLTGGATAKGYENSRTRFDQGVFGVEIGNRIVPEGVKRALYAKCANLIQWEPGFLPLEYALEIESATDTAPGANAAAANTMNEAPEGRKTLRSKIRVSASGPNLLKGSRRSQEALPNDVEIPSLTVGAKIARMVDLSKLFELYRLSQTSLAPSNLELEKTSSEEQRGVSDSHTGYDQAWELESCRIPHLILSQRLQGLFPHDGGRSGLEVHAEAIQSALNFLQQAATQDGLALSSINANAGHEHAQDRLGSPGQDAFVDENLPRQAPNDVSPPSQFSPSRTEDETPQETANAQSIMSSINAAAEVLRTTLHRIPQAAESVLGLGNDRPFDDQQLRSTQHLMSRANSLTYDDEESAADEAVRSGNARPLLTQPPLTILESLLSHPRLGCCKEVDSKDSRVSEAISGLAGDGYLIPLAGRYSWRAEYVAAFHMSFSSLVMFRSLVGARDAALSRLASKVRYLRFIVVCVITLLGLTGILASKQTSPQHYLPVFWKAMTVPSEDSSQIAEAAQDWDHVSKSFVSSTLSTMLTLFLLLYTFVEYVAIARRIDWRTRTLSMLDRHRKDFALWIEEKSNILHNHALQDFVLDDALYRTSSMALSLLPTAGGIAVGLITLILLIDLTHRGLSFAGFYGAGYLEMGSTDGQTQSILSLGNCIGSFYSDQSDPIPYPGEWVPPMSPFKLDVPKCEVSAWVAFQRLRYTLSPFRFTSLLLLYVTLSVYAAWAAYVHFFHTLAQRAFPSEKLIRSFATRRSRTDQPSQTSPNSTPLDEFDQGDVTEDGTSSSGDYQVRMTPQSPRGHDQGHLPPTRRPSLTAQTPQQRERQTYLRLMSADAGLIPSIRFVALAPERLTVTAMVVVVAALGIFASLLRGGNTITDARVAFAGHRSGTVVAESQAELAQHQRDYIQPLYTNYWLFSFSLGYFWGYALPCMVAVLCGGCLICLILIYNRVGSKLYRLYMRRLENIGKQAEEGEANEVPTMTQQPLVARMKSQVLYYLIDVWARLPYSLGPAPSETEEQALASGPNTHRDDAAGSFCCINTSRGFSERCSACVEKFMATLRHHDMHETFFLLITPILLIHMATDIRVTHLLPSLNNQYDLKWCTPLALDMCIDVDSTFVTWTSLTYFLFFSFIIATTFTLILVYRRLRLRSRAWWWLAFVYPFYVTYVAAMIKVKRYLTILNEVQNSMVDLAFGNQMHNVVSPSSTYLPDPQVMKLYRSLLQISPTMSSLGYFGYPGLLAALAALTVGGIVAICIVHFFLILTARIRKRVPEVYAFVGALREREAKEVKERRLRKQRDREVRRSERLEARAEGGSHDPEEVVYEDDSDLDDATTTYPNGSTAVLLRIRGDDDEEDDENDDAAPERDSNQPHPSEQVPLRLQPISSANPFASFVSNVAVLDRDSLREAIRPENISSACQQGYEWIVRTANDPDLEELELWVDYETMQKQREKAAIERDLPL